MKPNSRTCPQCSTKNRLEKEFCVKCGEPLEGIKAGDPNAAPAKGKPGFFVASEDEGQNPLVPLVLVLMTLGVAVAGWRYVADAPPPPVAPTAARPMTQASLPPSLPPKEVPGAKEYSEGIAALQAGDFQLATQKLRLAVAAVDRPSYHAGLAEALEKAGFIGESLREYEVAATKDPSNVRYSSEWARALNRAGRNTEAIRVYNTALRLDADNLALLREVTSLLVKGNDPTAARPHLQKIIRLQPDDLVPRQELAGILEAANDLPGASEQYRAILAAMPGAHLSRANLAEIFMKQDQPEEALKVLGEGLSVNANAALLHREKGRVLDRQGRDEEAIAAYREYLRLAPGAVDARVFTDRITQLTPTGEP